MVLLLCSFYSVFVLLCFLLCPSACNLVCPICAIGRLLFKEEKMFDLRGGALSFSLDFPVITGSCFDILCLSSEVYS